MPRGGVGDAAGTVPVSGAPTPCQGRKRPPDPAEANDRRGARCGGRPARRAARIARLRKPTPPKYARCRGATRRSPRRSEDHGQARRRLRPRPAVLRRRKSVGPERLSRPVGGQPGIRGFRSSAEEELRTEGRTLPGHAAEAEHAAEALRERIGSSADPQDQRGRKQTPCQRRGRPADVSRLGSNRRVPARRDRRTTQADHSGPRAHRRRHSLRSEHRVRPAEHSGLLPSVGDGGIHPAGRSRSADRGRPQQPHLPLLTPVPAPRGVLRSGHRDDPDRGARPRYARSGWCSPTDGRSSRAWSAYRGEMVALRASTPRRSVAARATPCPSSS